MKPQHVSLYEVTIRATNPNTGVITITTLTEYAYHAFDAGSQAILNYFGLVGGCSDRVEIVHVGPPLAFILAAQDPLEADVAAQHSLSRARRRAARTEADHG